MTILLIVLLIIVLGGGGWHTWGSPPWRGYPQPSAAPAFGFVQIVVAIIAIMLICALLGIY